MGAEWRAEIPAAVKGAALIGIEPDHMPALVRRYVDGLVGTRYLISITPILSEMRMIKSTQELQLARHAGLVANAMMDAGRAAIGDCVPEYEIAIATSQAGTRKAAELLTDALWRRRICRRIRISCKLWPPARRLLKLTTVPQHASCVVASQCFSAFAA